MFVKTNKNILVNLSNVSNVNIVKKKEQNFYRIIFNMNYCIEISKNKFVSDYVYWDFTNIESFKDAFLKIKSDEYLANTFLKQPKNSGFINIDEISSIKYLEDKLRIIFNLSHPVTFNYHGETKLTSEFIYLNFNNIEDFKEYSTYIDEELKSFETYII